MSSNIQSILTTGFEGLVVEIECQLSNGLPSIIIVGLGNKAVDEAKERIRSAFSSSGVPLPRKRITVNLAPADVPKESTSMDLAIAAAIITAGLRLQKAPDEDHVIIGEVGLNGVVRPVRGIIGKILAGQKLGIDTFYIPLSNLEQASLVPGITLYPVSHIQQLYAHLSDEELLSPHKTPESVPKIAATDHEYLLSDVRGQSQAKRALEIAAAGGHNILMSGPPGTGKSMLAKSLPSILPPLTRHEMLEVTHLHSLANNAYENIITTRPFRAPHHSSSHIAIVGGGNNVRPGEITLSHRGILFLDEIPEFNRQTLEALRQPLEDRKIIVARAKETISFPASFILVATANPCPCGYYGTPKGCSCSISQIQHYQRKLSGPILDRIDLFVSIESVDHAQLLSSDSKAGNENDIRSRIVDARTVQAARLGAPGRLNGDMSNKEMKQSALLTADAKALLNKAAISLELSGRSYMKIVKVSRTIADLEKSKYTLPQHISEALQYRPLGEGQR